LLLARRSAGLANLLLGRFEIARTEMEAMLDIYDRVRDGPETGLTTRDPKVSICTVLGICRTALGDIRSGAAAADDGIRHAESLEHVVSLVLALRRACVQRMMQRDTTRTSEYAGRLLAVDSEFQTFLGAREGLIFYSWAGCREQPESGLLARMHNALGELDAAQHWVMLPFFHGCVAELAGEQGEVDLASHLLHRASELIAQTGERWSEAEILRLKAKFCEGDASRAEQLLKTSLALAQNQHARLWELRSAITLAQLWRSQGREAEAGQLLTPIYACFPDATYAPDLDTAKALLQAID
jgi:hypothetical protein